MEDIKDLIRIVVEYTKKNIPLIDLKAQETNGNKELNLFLGIKNGDFNSDVEASHGIYGSSEVDFKFRMLKSRLNRKLLNHLFFLDFSSPKLPKSANAQQECLDFLHFARVLLRIGEEKIAIRLLYKTVDLAREYEFTDIVISSLKELRFLYSSSYRPKLFQNIKQQLEDQLELALKEEEAYAIYYETKLMLNSTVNNRKKDLDPVRDAVKMLSKMNKEVKSYNIYSKYIKLKIWLYNLEGSYEDLLEYLDALDGEYREGRIKNERFDEYLFKLSRLQALFKLQRFNEGLELAEKYLEEVDVDFLHWADIMEKYFLLAAHAGHYEQANDVLLEVLNSKPFSEMDELESSKWNLFRSYMYFLTSNRKLIKKFDYEAFINETPKYQKDLAGLNTAIILLQIMNNIDGDLGDLHKRMDAVDDYVGKFLNNSFSKRTKLICKLLNKIPVHNRDHDTIIQKSKYLEEKLQSEEIASDMYVDIEVVPYTKLWELAIQQVVSVNQSDV